MGHLNWWPGSVPLVLYEDNHCLALVKPAGMPTVADASGDPSATAWARGYIKQKYAKPGNVYLGVVHRLDRPVSGALLFARTSKAAARLTDQFRRGVVSKRYWAVVEGRPAWRDRVLEHYLWKDRRRNVVTVVSADHPEAKWCRLRVRVLATRAAWSLLEVVPETGRSHQIRVQLAHMALPIVGDVKYGARSRLPTGIALHAMALTFLHPTRKEPQTIEAPLPTSWRRFEPLLEAAIGADP